MLLGGRSARLLFMDGPADGTTDRNINMEIAPAARSIAHHQYLYQVAI
jgi:hypothetical protein